MGLSPFAGLVASRQRYDIIAPLGRGFSGLVYRVRDRELGADVALKTLLTRDPEQLYRLKQEFRALADIHHRNLVELYELVASSDECFFTMELVDGADLVDFVRDATPAGFELSPAQIERFVACARQLVAGVCALHEGGRLHRDIKPPNILVTRQDHRVVLLDFGFAVALGLDALVRAHSAAVAGTLAYMAPEQLWGQPPAPSSDWYSVGVVLHEALTGRLPIDRSKGGMQANAAPPPAASLGAALPPPLADLIVALLDPEPAKRPDSSEIIARFESATVARQRQPAALDLASEPFVGRKSELARLQEACDRVAAGHPVIVRMHGASGVGKSELMRRFVSTAATDGVAVICGRCHAQEAVPYKAFDDLVDSLSRFLSGLPEVEVAVLAPRHCGALLQLFPVLDRVAGLRGAAPPSVDIEPREARRRAFAAFRELIARLAERRRVLLWIDDVQWSDADSAVLAAELMRSPAAPNVLLVVSHRSEDRDDIELVEALKGVVAESTEVEFRSLELLPLSSAETRQLAQQLDLPGSARLDHIVDESGGSPLFVAQLAHHLRNSEAATLPVPELGLAAVLDANMAELSAAARAVVDLVAVAGRPIERGLALEAAGTGARARPVLRRLEQDRLLRSVTVGGDAGVEIYHDRIRELILGRLPAVTSKSLHQQLAQALTQRPNADPESIYSHFLAAEHWLEASVWADTAAQRAESALAFADAARLYGRALELGQWQPERRTGLTIQRAQALVNAGHGAQAAPLFLEASEHSDGASAIDLRRRAGEQFVVSGHLDEGTAVLRRLLKEFKLPYPVSPHAVLAGTLTRLLRVFLHGLDVRADAPPASAQDTLKLDVCRSAAKGFALVDPFRGLYFAVTTLLYALQMADRQRSGRALSEVGAALIPAGGPLGRWACQMISRANAIAESSDDAYLRGYSCITTAQQRMMEARWGEMLALSERGSELLRSQCRGVTWELDIGCMAAMRAVEELGDIEGLARRSEQLLHDSEATGDLFGTATALLSRSVAMLLRGDTTAAREMVHRVTAIWSPKGFHMQHLYAVRSEVYCDLDDAEPLRSWQRIEAAWPSIRAAGLLRHGLLKTDAHLMRARSALAVARSLPVQRDRMLRVATQEARQLSGQARADSIAHAGVLRAGIAALRGEAPQAQAHLRAAESTFGAADMKLGVALARHCSAVLSGSPGDAEAQQYTDAQRIDARRLLRMWAPAFAAA